MSGTLSRYRAETHRTKAGWHYRVLEGDREVLSSGAFLRRHDATTVGRHFAADDDLELLIRNR